MAKIFITQQELMAANDYIPIVDKDQWGKKIAERCIDKVSIAAKDEGFSLPMPAIFKDNMMMKSRYLMGAFASMYLKRSYEPTGDEYLMSADDYDTYAGSHIFNQIERMKGIGGEARDKAFDLLSDFKDLEKRLNTEVFNLLQILNDPAARIMSMIFAQSSPESLQKGAEALNDLKAELDAYKQSGGGEENGGQKG